MSEVAFTKLSVKALVSMPFQSRTTEDPELEELVESIKAYGVLEPLIVRQKPDGTFEIVAGERRFTAAKKAALTEVPVILKQLSDQEACEIQLVENVQRKDLADIEKAHMLDRMIKQFGYTQEKLAKKLGKSQPWVSQHLAMLKLPENITRVIMPSKISEGQAREILAAPEEKREEITKQIAETGEVPSSREIKKLARPVMVQCSRCPLGTYYPKDWNEQLVCPSCYDKLSQGKISLDKPQVPVEKPQRVEKKVYEPPGAWKERMQQPVSRMDEWIYEELQRRGVPVSFQEPICIKQVVPEVIIKKGDLPIAVFLDTPVTHQKRELLDAENRELLAKRGFRVLELKYDSFTEEQKQQIMNQILEMV